MKKIIAMILSAAMLCGTLAGCGSGQKSDAGKNTEAAGSPSQETAAYDYGDYYEAASFAGGSGTEADPYQISETSQLVLLARKMAEGDEDYTGAHYILTADISLNETDGFENWGTAAPACVWEPMGRTAAAFEGVLDGQGHAISGIYIHADPDTEKIAAHNHYGLFAQVSGTVKNLKIEKSYIAVSGNYGSVGAIAGQSTAEGTIENCVSNAMIEVGGGLNAGGIVGYGGIIQDCEFLGTLRQTEDGWCQLGGIAGDGGTIRGCTNSGSVSGKGYSGGIVGWADIVEDCVNKGSVSGDTAGGIAGNMYKAGTGLELDVTENAIRSCVNEGTVSAITAAGGILGKMGSSEADISMHVTDCENYGLVLCDAANAGILGRMSVEQAGVITIENCVNHANLTGGDKVGGIICEIVGSALHQEGDVTISGCKNEGDVVSAGMYSGGVVTYLLLTNGETDLKLNIADCVNTGTVTSASYAGGILCFSSSAILSPLNISGDSGITVKDCVNSGTVVGQSENAYAGGIAGNFGVRGIRTLFENCTNSGDVKLEFSLTPEEIQASQEAGFTMSISQIVGGIVGRLGEGLLLTTDHDNGSAVNVNAEDPWIVFRNCRSSGMLTSTDYSEYVTGDGKQIWKSYIGGIIGNASAEDAYSFRVENCTYTGADRGLGNPEYPDVGQAHTIF